MGYDLLHQFDGGVVLPAVLATFRRDHDILNLLCVRLHSDNHRAAGHRGHIDRLRLVTQSAEGKFPAIVALYAEMAVNI